MKRKEMKTKEQSVLDGVEQFYGAIWHIVALNGIAKESVNHNAEWYAHQHSVRTLKKSAPNYSSFIVDLGNISKVLYRVPMGTNNGVVI